MNWQHKTAELSAEILAKPQAPTPVKEAAWRLLQFAVRCRKSNPISFALRPFATSKHFRVSVGAIMAIVATIIAIQAPSQSFASENTGGSATLPVEVLSAGEVVVTTDESVVIPLKSTYYISQGFWPFHPGVDMATALGSPITPIMNGTVIKVLYQKWDYGNHVIIAHANNLETLYAHMGEIEVKEGQTVTTSTKIGEVGMSGRTSGPHLHLELREAGRAANPATFLGIK